MKISYRTVMLLALSLVILASWFGLSFIKFLKTPLLAETQKPVQFFYAPKTSSRALTLSLYHQKVLNNPFFFILLMQLDGSWRSLQPGEYSINPGTTPKQLLNQLVKGESAMHTFTIVEGWTFRQMLNALETNPYVTHTIIGLNDDAIMRAIGHEGEIPEGRFAPETYMFHAGTKDTEILKIAYNLLQQWLYQAWREKAKDAPYFCPYQTLIGASIIEKETAIKEERLKISGIIARRLRKKMYLGLDPTILYELKLNYGLAARLTAEDLTRDTRYNTYLHHGLPPTPISLPSQESIYAALHPMPGNDLYFFAKGDGGHVFSTTLEQHNKLIQKYSRSNTK